jgi:hypothetical protein
MFFKRLFCLHPLGRLMEITFDGEAIYKCEKCGKHIRKPL